jgi:hypothetical protein
MVGCWWSKFLQFARTTQGALVLALSAFALTYFLIWHTVHTLTVLPFALLLLCPLMHVFMHRGHGGRDSGHGQSHH